MTVDTKDSFEAKLNALCSKEVGQAQMDKERGADMIVELAKALSIAIAILTNGDKDRANSIMEAMFNTMTVSVTGMVNKFPEAMKR